MPTTIRLRYDEYILRVGEIAQALSDIYLTFAFLRGNLSSAKSLYENIEIMLETLNIYNEFIIRDADKFAKVGEIIKQEDEILAGSKG